MSLVLHFILIIIFKIIIYQLKVIKIEKRNHIVLKF